MDSTTRRVSVPTGNTSKIVKDPSPQIDSKAHVYFVGLGDTLRVSEFENQGTHTPHKARSDISQYPFLVCPPDRSPEHYGYWAFVPGTTINPETIDRKVVFGHFSDDPVKTQHYPQLQRESRALDPRVVGRGQVHALESYLSVPEGAGASYVKLLDEHVRTGTVLLTTLGGSQEELGVHLETYVNSASTARVVLSNRHLGAAEIMTSTIFFVQGNPFACTFKRYDLHERDFKENIVGEEALARVIFLTLKGGILAEKWGFDYSTREDQDRIAGKGINGMQGTRFLIKYAGQCDYLNERTATGRYRAFESGRNPTCANPQAPTSLQ